MVSLKTKVDKHANDNEKRRKSLKEKEKAKLSQSQIIKQALSNSNISKRTSKKIIFTDENEGTNNSKGVNVNEKPVLFDSSDSENEDFEIREKFQFSGKKGFELLNLQSTYGNDERFKIDERFLEDEVKSDDGNITSNDEEKNDTTDKVKQLKILDSVLETSAGTPVHEKKAKKRTFEMIRYDASKKDHEIYEINTQPESIKVTKKRKAGRKTPKVDKEDFLKPQVSKEKFYEVSSEIKSHFKEKKEEGGQFSLLQTYGFNSPEENLQDKEESDREEEKDCNNFMNEISIEKKTEFNTSIGKEEETTNRPKREKTGITAKGIWKDPFFFAHDDFRFKEALEFINKKHSPEAAEAAENYDKTRKKIREVLRLHLKKQMHKKDPFKNKVGGMNKKQRAHSKLKNPREIFDKRKQPKVKIGKRT